MTFKESRTARYMLKTQTEHSPVMEKMLVEILGSTEEGAWPEEEAEGTRSQGRLRGERMDSALSRVLLVIRAAKGKGGRRVGCQ